ncbi:hypothetical protein [Gracilimonas sediminicola]|uniref:Uncharacterized protein n=1 Tax=Gracilimonas sediminicola TaxID=2952158 RepID=A0A9X2L0E8_9BACT|nr:hypothetical protein [Gracilimonas sediminicola]MCP9290000.1 hypothetical protein [Gracilimonas sediminicola]
MQTGTFKTDLGNEYKVFQSKETLDRFGEGFYDLEAKHNGMVVRTVTHDNAWALDWSAWFSKVDELHELKSGEALE